MNKKVIIGIAAAAIVIAVIVVVCLVCFSSKEINMEEVSAKIAETGKFNEMAMQDIDQEYYQTYMSGNLENVEAITGKFPLMNIQSSMFMIIKAKEGTVDLVKQDIENFAATYEQRWATYLPEQYDYVKNRKVGTYGNYAYIIIAENSEELEKLVK